MYYSNKLLQVVCQNFPKLHKMVRVAGFGNPLLDISVKIRDHRLLKKYGLQKDGQKEVAEDIFKSILSEVSEHEMSYSPGGCAQNTLRILQWVLNVPKSTYIYGSVGNDEIGEKLRLSVEKDGVITRYVVHKCKATGTTIALTGDEKRSLIAHIGAADHLEFQELIDKEKSENILSTVDIIYMEGFFLTNRIEVAKYILNFAKKHNKLFVFNISGAYMCEDYPEEMKYFCNESDLLFGNTEEYAALSSVSNFRGTAKEFAINLSKQSSTKTVVVTDGSRPVTCAYNKGQLAEINPIKVPECDVKDTTGAGDSFVSGFLAGLIQEREPKICLKWGCWVAQNIVKQVGCTVPSYSAAGIKDIE